MNKVLVTGLGVANGFGACDACNLDFSWIINNPSTLLWADKICIPKDAYEKEIQRGSEKLDKVIQLFLNMTDERKLIDKIDVSEMYQDNMGERIYNQAVQDSHKLIEVYPHKIKKGDEKVPDEIVIENQGYCGSWMASVYASLILARDLDANCLFGNREHTFLKYLYGLNTNLQHQGMKSEVYNEIFSLYLPESIAVHNYATTTEEKCQTCKHYENCESKYLDETQGAFSKVLEWREYDEIQQAKEVIDKIVKSKDEIISENDINDLIGEFKEKQEKINKNINSRFPKIERWTKMTTVMGAPLTIAGAITGNEVMTAGGVTLFTAGEAMEKILETYKSKNNWVGFINNLK